MGCYAILYLSGHDKNRLYSGFMKDLKSFERQSMEKHEPITFLSLISHFTIPSAFQQLTSWKNHLSTCHILLSNLPMSLFPGERENEPYVSVCMKQWDSNSMMSVNDNVLHVLDNASLESQQAIRILWSTLFSRELNLFKMYEYYVCLSFLPSVCLSIHPPKMKSL